LGSNFGGRNGRRFLDQHDGLAVLFIRLKYALLAGFGFEPPAPA
jgi:hypothetical protein